MNSRGSSTSSATIKVGAARLSGWLLIGLAVMLFVEVLRRFFGGEAPVGPAMMAMAAVNAALNIICLRLLKRHRGDDVNFKASATFTSNDSIVNLDHAVWGAGDVVRVEPAGPDPRSNGRGHRRQWRA